MCLVNVQWRALKEEIVQCRRCPRLVEWRERVAKEKKKQYMQFEYWGKPVPGFGDEQAHLLVVGLAPGAHGSNRTGRMFTGDASGNFLYPALYRAGFANQPQASHQDDGLMLKDLYISALCRCAPPANKPTPNEIKNCLPYLQREITLLKNIKVVVALGSLAFRFTIEILMRGMGVNAARFGHGTIIPLDNQDKWFIASYHPSRQNTQTGRLTVEMFDKIWSMARSLLQDTKGGHP
jgi:uracil-DNA glycosylase family 4